MPKLEPRLARVERLLEISRELASTTSLERLLHRIVEAAVELTGSETAGILPSVTKWRVYGRLPVRGYFSG